MLFTETWLRLVHLTPPAAGQRMREARPAFKE